MTVSCLACGLSVPDHRAAPVETPAGTYDVCLGCYSGPEVRPP